MGARDMDLDEFLRHKSGSGGGVRQLKNWKKNPASGDTPANSVDVLLHRQSRFTVVWRHSLPRLTAVEDKQTRRSTVHVWGQKLVCWEDEETCKDHAGHYRGRESRMPGRCPLCKLGDWLFAKVSDGTLAWTEPVFKFEGDIPQETKVIHAGGWYGAFGAKDMTDPELDDLKKHGISPMTAWQENALPKAEYIFAVVQHQRPEDGVLVTVEPALLGDKVKKLVLDKIEAEDERGNPLRHPYVIRFKHLPNEKEFHKKYDAIAVPKLKVEPRHLAAITDTPFPSLGYLTEEFSADAVRAELEKHALIDIPWDELFGGKPGPRASASVTQAKAPAPAEEEFACDECGKAMKASDAQCPHCGHRYEVEMAAPPPEPAKPALKKRSTAAKPAATKVAPKPQVPDPDPFNDANSDDVPF